MNQATYDELALERIAKEKFGFTVDIQSIILWHADVSRTAKASVFLTNKKQLMLYLEATSPLILSDVKKIISRMGMRSYFYRRRGSRDILRILVSKNFVRFFLGASM